MSLLTRRALVGSLAAGGAGLLAGCDSIGQSPQGRELLFTAENFHRWSQRLLLAPDALAREYRPEERSRIFRSNGTANPATEHYKALWRGNFADWRLEVTGLVARPLRLSLADIAAMPHREQITRHDCVEGWSAIGKWRGVPLARVLEAVGLQDRARYLVFHCLDEWGGGIGTGYYESIDRVDAFHPQTILAYGLNDRPLPVQNGAPLRLRVERQLGYKQAKYLARIEAVDSLLAVRGGKGGYWEDRAGYEWYAGI